MLSDSVCQCLPVLASVVPETFNGIHGMENEDHTTDTGGANL